VSDDDILSRIKTLVDEERALAGDNESAQERKVRRRHLEEQLDQCWDLLRQRQALRESGGDPNAAHERPVSEVESYLQ
jgi:uncharacterized protein DUF2630